MKVGKECRRGSFRAPQWGLGDESEYDGRGRPLLFEEHPHSANNRVPAAILAFRHLDTTAVIDRIRSRPRNLTIAGTELIDELPQGFDCQEGPLAVPAWRTSSMALWDDRFIRGTGLRARP